MFFLIFPIITVVAYIFIFGNIWFNKHINAKSFAHVALLCNIVTIAIIYVTQRRVPMGGFLEVGAETALVLGVIYALFIPIDLRKLSLWVVGGAIVFGIISFAGGLELLPYLYTYVSWWQQLSIQAHILANGFLVFSLICYGSLIFGKNAAHVDPKEITGFARMSLTAAILVFVLGILATLLWNFAVTGELLLWDTRLLMKLLLLCALLVPLVSQAAWFKKPLAKTKFDGMVTALVFLVNLYEWGGLF